MTPNQPNKMKRYGVVAGVVLVLAVAYLYMSGGSSPSSGTLTAGTQYGTVGASELALLNQVRSLSIDTSLFTDPSFLSLVDYSVAIPPQSVGVRPNPFAPLPGMPSQSASSATPTAAATAPTK